MARPLRCRASLSGGCGWHPGSDGTIASAKLARNTSEKSRTRTKAPARAGLGSGRRRREPAMPIVDPMAQPEAGGSQIREGFVVAQDVAALDADPPVPALAAVVLD